MHFLNIHPSGRKWATSRRRRRRRQGRPTRLSLYFLRRTAAAAFASLSPLPFRSERRDLLLRREGGRDAGHVYFSNKVRTAQEEKDTAFVAAAAVAAVTKDGETTFIARMFKFYFFFSNNNVSIFGRLLVLPLGKQHQRKERNNIRNPHTVISVNCTVHAVNSAARE